MPPGADAVVMVEETKLVEATEEGEEVKVEILTKVSSLKIKGGAGTFVCSMQYKNNTHQGVTCHVFDGDHILEWRYL